MKQVFGHFFSILFIPLLLPLYGSFYVLRYNPFHFPDSGENAITLIRVGLLTFVFPAITILLLAALKFIKSVNIYDRQERIIPYIAAGFFYIWAFYVFYREEMNSQIQFILLGATIAIFIDFLANILLLKISMHTTGGGGLIAMVMLLTPYTEFNALPVLLIAILVAGCIGAARLALNAHTEREVFYGYLSGFFSFMVAANFYNI